MLYYWLDNMNSEKKNMFGEMDLLNRYLFSLCKIFADIKLL